LSHAIPAAGAQTVYQGGFKVENLRVVETDADETVIGWKLAATEQLKLLAQPNSLEIGDLRVQDLGGKVIIEKDGSFNLANLFKAGDAGQPDKAESKPVEPGAPFAYHVRRVLINDGRITFADRRLRIPFDTRIHELRGNIAGIASVKDARSELRLRGRVDEFGTARAEGEIDTADPKRFTNVKVAFRNLEMAKLTPYSGQFAGRTIDAGKLTVDLAYDIDNGQLKGDNKIVVEQLKLGEKVESPEAVNLPLDLAVALLKDSKGVIDLGLPVQGDLNNPQFSFGALIGKTLVNVLKKIATSPFRALGALIPGGGEATLDQVAFDPGRTKVPPPEKEKLLKLAEAMRQRPQIKLVVQGRYHPEKDRQFLARRGLRKTVTLRLGQTATSDDSPNPLDFSSSDTREALEEMFEERFGEDALEAFEDEMKAARKEGRAADAGFYAKELFARLLAVEVVPDEMLLELAQGRAKAVTAELVAQGLPAERFGTREPVALEAAAETVTIALSMEARQ
jgi:outer membrane protein OmpA-like peptidoglycan-associated protein